MSGACKHAELAASTGMRIRCAACPPRKAADAARAARERLDRKRKRAFLRWVGNGERCSTCAYRAGTEASGDEVDRGLVRLRRALLDAAQAFYCHDEGPIPGKKRLCIGHMDAISARFRAGYYTQHPPDAPEVLEELREAYRIREEHYNEWQLAYPEQNPGPK